MLKNTILTARSLPPIVYLCEIEVLMTDIFQKIAVKLVIRITLSANV